MKIKLIKIQLLLVISCLLLQNCDNINNEIKTNLEIVEKIKPKVSKEVFEDILDSIASPISSIATTKFYIVGYDSISLSSFRRFDNPKSYIQDAWLFGASFTNLGYALIDKNSEASSEYLSIMGKQAQKLKFMKQYNVSKSLKFIQEEEFDSVLFMMHSQLEEVNKHLFKKNKTDLTAVILIASQVESLYLFCKAAKKNPRFMTIMSNAITHKGFFLKKLIYLLSYYEDYNEDIRELIDEINIILDIYDKELDLNLIAESVRRDMETGIVCYFDDIEQYFSPKVINKLSKIAIKLRDKMLVKTSI